MCGIIGYVGKGDCGNIILEGLRALEYRGYDSWGIALKTENESCISLKKAIGRISNAKDISCSESCMGMGHTRWATHGKVSDNNSHPHYDEKKRFFVVHNGIIENHIELRKKCRQKFYSDTDTEVIPKLIAENMKKGLIKNGLVNDESMKSEFEKAVMRTASMLKGNYAFVAMDKDSDVMIAVRKGSPLVIGAGNKETFISSDMASFLNRTKEVFYMDDGEAVVIGDKLRFIDLKGRQINKSIEHIEWDTETALKGKHKHFMLKEILEQPSAIRETVKGCTQDGKIMFQGIDKDLMGNVKRIVVTACGTSWHAGLVSEYWFEGIAGIPVEVEYASEFRYKDPVIIDGTLVIAISQSGETADTIAAMKEAKKRGAKILSICNVVGSTIDRFSDISISTRAGPEIGVASTKAFTTQLAVLYLLALKMAGKDCADKEFMAIPDKMENVLSGDSNDSNIRNMVNKYIDTRNALFLGRGVNYPIALEGALKLKEISYIHAEGYPAAEMKHGPIALIDKEMPTVFICTKDRSYEKVVSNIEEVKARQGIVIAIATLDDKEIRRIADDVIYIPKTSHDLMPFLAVLPLQLLAYHIADKRGCDIDKPRNLAKSVTVE